MTEHMYTQDNEGGGSLLGAQGVNCRFLGAHQAKRDGVVVKDIDFEVRLLGLEPCPTHAVAMHS